jgi:glycosyltransferase involved in cell wall biosynthesis
MHILHFISAYGAGHVGNEIHGELGRAIIARGHRYSVLALGGRSAQRGLRVWDDGGIAVHEIGAGRSPAARAEGALSARLFHYPPFLFAARWYGRLLQGRLRDVDLVLVEGGYPLGAVAALWQPVTRRPLAVVLQGGDMHREDAADYGFGRYAVARRLLALTLRRAALLRTYSPLARDAAIERGADPARIAVVAQNIGEVCYPPQGVDLGAFRAQARAAVAERYGLRAPHLLVALGRLLPIKGFDGLIRSLPLAEAIVGAPIELLLCGPSRRVAGLGDYRAELERLAAECGVGERVRFAGEVPHDATREHLAAADVLAVPSVMEGGAKVLLEAAAVGTPFVATETSGTPAFLPDGGLTTPPIAQAPEAFGRALAVIFGNPELRARLARRGYEQSPRFSAEARADELLPLYIQAARG